MWGTFPGNSLCIRLYWFVKFSPNYFSPLNLILFLYRIKRSKILVIFFQCNEVWEASSALSFTTTLFYNFLILPEFLIPNVIQLCQYLISKLTIDCRTDLEFNKIVTLWISFVSTQCESHVEDSFLNFMKHVGDRSHIF